LSAASAVPPQLDRMLLDGTLICAKQKTRVKRTRVSSAPVSLYGYAVEHFTEVLSLNTQLSDNGRVSGAAYSSDRLTLGAQLPGPFSTRVHTDLAPYVSSLNAA